MSLFAYPESRECPISVFWYFAMAYAATTGCGDPRQLVSSAIASPSTRIALYLPQIIPTTEIYCSFGELGENSHNYREYIRQRFSGLFVDVPTEQRLYALDSVN